jgi:lactam utilization protein B
MDTICLHGDRPDAKAFAELMHAILTTTGHLRIRPFGADA